MGLNLKDEETVALVAEVAKRLGTTKTAAVRELARERIRELDRAKHGEQRVSEITAWLEREVWPHTQGVEQLTKAEEEDLLGYNDMTAE